MLAKGALVSLMSVIMALDFGVKKMGVAVGNLLTHTGEAHSIVPMENGTPDWSELLTLLNDWQVSLVLVGLPLNMDSSISHLSKRARKFAKRLNHKLKEAHISCQVGLVDERLSSCEAFGAQPKKLAPAALVDDKAALVLLHSYFAEPKVEILP